MEGLRKVLLVAGVALAIVVIGVVVGMLATSGREVAISSPPPASTGGPATNPVPVAPLRPRTATSPPPVTASAPGPASPAVSVTGAPAAPAPSILITNWPDRLDAVLEASGSEAKKARELMEMFPRLPEDGKLEVAEHLTNLVTDENYSSLGNWLTNTALPEDVLDTLLSDLLNRPNALKLPLLVDIARDPSNPKAAEAKDLLELYLEEDYGTDWTTWRSKAEQWVKDNPE